MKQKLIEISQQMRNQEEHPQLGKEHLSKYNN